MIELKNRPVFRLCNDSVFKEIFTKVPNALASLISVCLEIDYLYLKNNMQIELNELSKNKSNNKTTVCDLVVKISDNLKIDIEVNKSNPKGLTERSLLYASRLYSNSVPKGASYSELTSYKVAQLNINAFSNGNEKMLGKFMLMDLDTKLPVTKAMILYNFDIAKCYKVYYNKSESNIDYNDKLIRWGAILYTDNILDIAEIIGDDLMEKEDKETFIKVLRNLEEKDRSYTDDEILQREQFRLEAEREIGKEEGLELGIELTKIDTVKKMLVENLDIELISKITELTNEEIMKIKESN